MSIEVILTQLTPLSNVHNPVPPILQKSSIQLLTKSLRTCPLAIMLTRLKPSLSRRVGLSKKCLWLGVLDCHTNEVLCTIRTPQETIADAPP